MRIWTLTNSLEGTSVTLTEVPFWAWAAETLPDQACWLLEKATGFCLINPPEWMWNIQWGEPDEDDYNPHTLGSAVWRFGQAFMNGFGAYKRAKDIVSIPVSYEWVREHFPDAGWPWDGTESGGDGDQGVPPA